MGRVILRNPLDPNNKYYIYTCDICLKQEKGLTSRLPSFWSNYTYSSGIWDCFCKDCAKEMNKIVMDGKYSLKDRAHNITKGDNVNESDKN